jgi:hypothetical protein
MLLVSVVKQGDGQPFESKPPAPPKSEKEPNPIPARAPKSFTMGRNRCSRWPGSPQSLVKRELPASCLDFYPLAAPRTARSGTPSPGNSRKRCHGLNNQ